VCRMAEHDAEWPGAGEMSDAGEVVMALYEQLAPVATKANQPGLLNHIFGLHVKVWLSFVHVRVTISRAVLVGQGFSLRCCCKTS